MSLDLTRGRLLSRVVKNPLFPAVLQWITLAVFVFLILLGWNYHGIRGVDLPDPLAYTNVNTLFFWVIWLMGLIVLVPLIGRLWCTACPLGYINDILARFGLRRRYPRGLRNLYLAAGLLLLYNGLVAYFKINHYPDYSARLLLGIVALLVAVGLVFRGRIFCGYLCPIGAMVGIYSRVSPWRLEARDRGVCRTCASKACYLGEEKWYRLDTPVARLTFPFRRPGCQVDLFPPEMSEDPRCVMCTQCIKNCPYDNISWSTRPFLRGVVTPGVPAASEAVFIVFLLGATISIFTRVWPALNGLVVRPGAALASAAGLGGPAAWIVQVAWSYALLPLAFTSLLTSLAYLASRSRIRAVPAPEGRAPAARLAFGLAERDVETAAGEEGWRRKRLTPAGIFSALTLSFIPLILSAHWAFALVKINEKISYLPGALADPTGVKFYLAIHKLGMMAAPAEFLPLWLVRWLALSLVVLGAAASIWAAMRLAAGVYPDLEAYRRRAGGTFALGNLLLGGVYASLVVKWLF